MKSIKNRYTSSSCLLVVQLLLVLAVSGQKKQPVPVVIIMADQLRYDVIGELTPNINSLRENGVVFNRTYCASPLCAPSRGAFFTGLYPNRSGSLINPWEKEDEAYGNIKPGIPTMYSLMAVSWDSRHVGKQHLFAEKKIDKDSASKTKWITQEDYSAWMKEKKLAKPGGKGFKDVSPEIVSGSHTRLRGYSIPTTGRYEGGLENYFDHYVTDKSIEAIRGRDRSRPLLLNAMYLAPHPPFDVPEPYFSMFPAAGVKLPENVGQWYPGQSPLQMYNLTGFLGSRYSREQWQGIWSKYLGLVKMLDDEVGRLIAALKQEGIYDDALIVFTADHGEMLGSHMLWQKMCMYEESARVPLIIKMPRSTKPATGHVDQPVSMVDVLPTIMELTGTKTSQPMDGVSLLPAINGKGSNRKPVFIQYDGNGSLGSTQRAVVKGKYKIVADLFKDETYLELYDVVNDPSEKNNLMFDERHVAVAEDMIIELKTQMKNTGDRITIQPDIRKKFLSSYKPGIDKSGNNQ